MARTLKDGESLIIHYNGTVETGLTKDNVESGEIAILRGTGATDTALYTKDQTGELVKFISQTAVDAKVSGATGKVDALEKKHSDDYNTLSGLVETEKLRATSAETANTTAIKTNTDAIAVLNGDESTEGSVKKAVNGLKTSLEAQIDTVEGDVQTISGNVNTLSATTIPNLKQEISGLVATEESRAKGEEKKLSESISALTTGSTVTLSSDETDSSILKKYTISQGGKSVGVINIPLDMVVNGGEVVNNPEVTTTAGTETYTGKYLKLNIANQKAPVYINVKDLAHVYTGSDSIEISDSDAISVKKDADGNYIFANKQVEKDLADEVARAKAAEKANADAITVLNDAETVEGSVKKAVADAIASESARTEGAYAKKATTLDGYGISDAKIENGVITLGTSTITPIIETTQYIQTVESTDSVALNVDGGKLTAKVIKVYGGTF